MNKGKFLTILVVLTAVGSLATAQENQFKQRAQKLADLRGEIGRLESRIQTERETGLNEVQSLISQTEELELLIQKEKIRLKTLERMITEKRDADSAAKQAVEELKTPVLAAIQLIRETVLAGLPFRLEERLAELDHLQASLTGNTADALTIASRLWQFVEDELKLSSETGQYRQVIEIEGVNILADVVRVGMMLMFYRTEDGRYGTTTKKEGLWAFEQVTNKEATDGIDALFDSLRRQVRQGQFNLPIRLEIPGGGAR